MPWDSDGISGNLCGPRRYHRGLQRSFYLSAQVSVFFCPVSKAYCDRKRKGGRGASRPCWPLIADEPMSCRP
ncbi:hypothetical protein ACFVFQ_37000 [Streptomyces sp. NPDC057743]|uniref:hypothetical protein n=1 Tax=Streptomyces sp. NPDC057743 TaxID=3346236 RepID=UPI003688E034